MLLVKWNIDRFIDSLALPVDSVLTSTLFPLPFQRRHQRRSLRNRRRKSTSTWRRRRRRRQRSPSRTSSDVSRRKRSRVTDYKKKMKWEKKSKKKKKKFPQMYRNTVNDWDEWFGGWRSRDCSGFIVILCKVSWNAFLHDWYQGWRGRGRKRRFGIYNLAWRNTVTSRHQINLRKRPYISPVCPPNMLPCPRYRCNTNPAHKQAEVVL